MFTWTNHLCQIMCMDLSTRFIKGAFMVSLYHSAVVMPSHGINRNEENINLPSGFDVVQPVCLLKKIKNKLRSLRLFKEIKPTNHKSPDLTWTSRLKNCLAPTDARLSLIVRCPP